MLKDENIVQLQQLLGRLVNDGFITSEKAQKIGTFLQSGIENRENKIKELYPEFESFLPTRKKMVLNDYCSIVWMAEFGPFDYISYAITLKGFHSKYLSTGEGFGYLMQKIYEKRQSSADPLTVPRCFELVVSDYVHNLNKEPHYERRTFGPHP